MVDDEPTAPAQDGSSVMSVDPAIAAADRMLGDELLGLWHAIQQRHPELPSTPPLEPRPAGGWFSAAGLTRRYPRQNPLRSGADAVLTQLLQEAAHELGALRGIGTTSTRGRYHNQRFRDLGIEVGLHVEVDDPTQPGGGQRGWSRASLPEETRRDYGDMLTRLNRVLASYPQREDTEPQRAMGSRKVTAVCGCARPRRFQMYQSQYDLGPITCAVCGHEFRARPR